MKYCTACQKTFPSDYQVCPEDRIHLHLAHEFQPGMIIRNKYQILDRIGAGGMGYVYRARHLTFNEPCAIKVVSDSIASDENFLRRFQTEAVVMRKLRHPNAVRVDDFDYTDDGRPFIVMELVEGKDLSQVIKKDGPLPARRAAQIARQVAEVLGAAHALGIIHRDIKPGNIILTIDTSNHEAAKVLDFGIAKLREVAGQARPEMTLTGMQVGTPMYMSPEQCLGKNAGGEIDGRADLYSLGIMLYQMVTGRFPFAADTPYSLMRQQLEVNAPPPHEMTPDLCIPQPLSWVILKAMEKRREDRFHNAADFIAALDAVVGCTPPMIGTLEISDHIKPYPSAHDLTGSPSRRGFNRSSALVVVIAVVLAALIATVGYASYKRSRQNRIRATVEEKLQSAPLQTLRNASITVSVQDLGEVALDGSVYKKEDSALASTLTASVAGVRHVTNRINLKRQVESSSDLLAQGRAFLDAGNYQDAIDSFRKASELPNPGDAKIMFDRALRAQQTEVELLKSRH